jgi:hypothetical protein
VGVYVGTPVMMSGLEGSYTVGNSVGVALG